MTIDELNALTTLTAADEVPVWDSEESGEPTKKITASNLAASVKSLGNLIGTGDLDSTPTQGSNKAVTSGGTYTAIQQSTATGGAGYFKSPDGTLIQWGSYAGASVTATQTGSIYMANIRPNITFQIPFVGSAPQVSVLQYGGYGAVFACAFNSTGISSVDLARPTSGSITPDLHWIAIGRWK